MTEVAFHFNAPDKLAYACRFVRKASARQVKLVVLGPLPLLQALSPRLWALSPTDFLAHASLADGAHLLAASPIALLEQLEMAPHHEVLLNLGEDMPQGFEAFAKVVEVVSSHDEQDRLAARERWKQYAARGFDIVRHDLVLKG